MRGQPDTRLRRKPDPRKASQCFVSSPMCGYSTTTIRFDLFLMHFHLHVWIFTSFKDKFDGLVIFWNTYMQIPVVMIDGEGCLQDNLMA